MASNRFQPISVYPEGGIPLATESGSEKTSYLVMYSPPPTHIMSLVGVDKDSHLQMKTGTNDSDLNGTDKSGVMLRTA
jgi:hypothetical protein